MTRVREPLDLRLVLLGLVVWLGCLTGFLFSFRGLAVSLLLVGLLVVVLRRRRALSALGAGGALLFLLGSLLMSVRSDLVAADRLATSVGPGGYLAAVAVVDSDPVLKDGDFSSYVVVRLRLTSVQIRGRWLSADAPVVAVAPPSWQDVALGSSVALSGTFSTSDRPELAGTLRIRRSPQPLSGPPALLRGAHWVRTGIEEAASISDTSSRFLVPGLVVGDDAGLSDQVTQEFRTSGLTHLTAVSGTNLTLVIGFLLVVARWLGLRGRILGVVGMAGVVGFVLVARPDPSVLRAAVMGSVALLGMWTGSANRGLRGLGASLVLLLLLDPWLAVSAGFALSALATGGILLLGPAVAGGLAQWMPRWAADALAVPFAAQLACTPLIAAISGQVSLVSVVANLLAGVAVGPATVLGLIGGLVVQVVPPVGLLLGRLACWCADWILLVAHRAAGFQGAAVGWDTTAVGILLLSVACVAVALLAPRAARHPAPVLAVTFATILFVVHPLRVPWAPAGWIFVVCDVGQGDGLVVSTGPGAAVVVDTGPDPAPMDRCLDDLGVRQIPLLVLTHFHADHVDGITGVLQGRTVGQVWVSGSPVPHQGATYVADVTGREQLSVSVPGFGTTVTVGGVSLQVVSPDSGPHPDAIDNGDGTIPNNASIVLAVESQGISMLLTGDVETEAQRRLEPVLAGRTFDVLKVPHHGSSRQDLELLAALHARVALISVGVGNPYGHPDGNLVGWLRGQGMLVGRTDQDGALAIVDDGGLRLVRQRR